MRGNRAVVAVGGLVLAGGLAVAGLASRPDRAVEPERTESETPIADEPSAAAEEATTAERADPSPIIDPSEFTQVLPPDAIPAIDEPVFAHVEATTELALQEPVLAIARGGGAKAYPLRIMMWHEVVNDEIGGVPVAVTYCPLCNTGIAFRRPVVDGELLDFGTSGSLYHSNLVMYDRQTESYWPQATGQAVAGPLTGTRLEFLPIQIVAFADFAAAHPDGLVLTEDTGFARSYGTNPYVNYDGGAGPTFDNGKVDPRLPARERVLGVAVGDERLAFPYSELRDRAVGDWSAVGERIGGESVVVLWKQGTVSALDAPLIADSRAVGAVGAFSPEVEDRKLTLEARADGVFDVQTGSRWDVLGRAVEGPLAGAELARVIATDSYWFDWAAFFPSTGVFGLK